MSVIGLRLLTGMDRLPSGPRRQPVGRQPVEYSNSETALLLAAAVTFIGGLIHVGAAVDHFSGFPLYTLVFCLLAAGQIAWAAMLLRHPSQRVMLLGCAFQLGIVALWALSRTVGLPIAPQAWVPEEIGVADLMETIGELASVIAVLCVVMSPRLELARVATRRMAPVLLAVVLVSALFGAGAHAG
ncbi:MAG: hypothetical protein ACHQHO_13510 [Solirubrobacterales bacterium]